MKGDNKARGESYMRAGWCGEQTNGTDRLFGYCGRPAGHNGRLVGRKITPLAAHIVELYCVCEYVARYYY